MGVQVASDEVVAVEHWRVSPAAVHALLQALSQAHPAPGTPGFLAGNTFVGLDNKSVTRVTYWRSGQELKSYFDSPQAPSRVLPSDMPKPVVILSTPARAA
jgi:heme-degrading monooxygenase HmoA